MDNILDDMELLLILLESKCGKDELLNLGVTFLIVYILIKMLGVGKKKE